jgi:hypothetical protein
MVAQSWQRTGDWIGAEVEDNFVIVHIESGRYVGLNRTANAIWQALEEPLTSEQLAKRLCESFDVTEEHCLTSVERTLKELSDRQLVAMC